MCTRPLRSFLETKELPQVLMVLTWVFESTTDCSNRYRVIYPQDITLYFKSYRGAQLKSDQCMVRLGVCMFWVNLFYHGRLGRNDFWVFWVLFFWWLKWGGDSVGFFSVSVCPNCVDVVWFPPLNRVALMYCCELVWWKNWLP